MIFGQLSYNKLKIKKKLHGTRVPCNIYIYIYIYFKFDRPIPIAAFKEPYSGVLNGTQAPWTQVPCKFYLFIFLSLIAPYYSYVQGAL